MTEGSYMFRKISVKDQLRYHSISDEIIDVIKYALERQKLKYDRTYRSVIKEATPEGYVVEIMGAEKTIQCCIPGLVLKPGQMVWVKEPMGDIRSIHICGVAGK